MANLGVFFMGNNLAQIWDPLFLRLASSVLAAVFLLSAVRKIRDLRYFTGAVAAYRLLPRSWIRPFAYTLPWLELALGLMLLLGWGTRAAAITSAALLLLFLFAIGINLARGRKHLDCGCSGRGHRQKIGWKVIARDVILLLVAIPLALFGGGFPSFDNLPASTQQLIFDVFIIGILLPLVLAVAGLYQLAHLIRQLALLVRLSALEQRQ